MSDGSEELAGTGESADETVVEQQAVEGNSETETTPTKSSNEDRRRSSVLSDHYPPPSPAPGDYRAIILKRLNANSAKVRQFENIIASFNYLAEELSRRKVAPRARITSESGGSTVSDAQLEALRLELSDVYKKKSINDQHLIDANKMVAELQKKLDAVTKERDELAANRTKLFARLAELETALKKTEDDRDNVKDEYTALLMNFQTLEEKAMSYENERIQLIDRIRQLQEKQAEFFNTEIDKHKQLQQAKMAQDIASAMKDIDAGDELCPIGDDYAEMIGDFLPTECVTTFECNEGEATSVAWLDIDTFAIGGSDKMIRVWKNRRAGNMEKISTLCGCNQTVTRIDYNSTSRSVLASSNDHTARLWNLDTGRLLTTLSGHTDKVSSARFLLDSQIVSGSFDRSLKIFDVRNGKIIRSFFPGSSVLDVASVGSAFVSGHMDKKVRLWDGRQQEPTKTVEMGQRVTCVEIAFDQKQMLCSMRDDTLVLLDLRNLYTIHSFAAEQYRTSTDMTRCTISPGMDYIAAGSTDGQMFVWNVNSTKLEKKLYKRGLGNPVMCLAWNPSGRGLLSTDKMKTAAYWM